MSIKSTVTLLMLVAIYLYTKYIIYIYLSRILSVIYTCQYISLPSQSLSLVLYLSLCTFMYHSIPSTPSKMFTIYISNPLHILYLNHYISSVLVCMIMYGSIPLHGGYCTLLTQSSQGTALVLQLRALRSSTM